MSELVRNDDTVWEVRGKHFSRTRCQNLSVRGQRVSLFLFSIFLSFYLSIHPSSPSLPLSILTCTFSSLHSFFSLIQGSRTLFHLHAQCEDHSSAKKNKKKQRRCWRWRRRAHNTSPTQHHDSLQLHKCVFFPDEVHSARAEPPAPLPVRAQLDLVLKAKHLPENTSDGRTCVRAQLFILKFLFFFFYNFIPAN